MSVRDYSATAASNTAVGSITLSNAMLASAVDDAIREAMADTAGLLDDIANPKATTGSANAYALATGKGVTGLTKPILLILRANHAATGAATLAVDSLGATALKMVDAAGLRDVAAGDIVANGVYLVTYSAALACFVVVNPTFTPNAALATLNDPSSNARKAVRVNTTGTGFSYDSGAPYATWAATGAALKTFLSIPPVYAIEFTCSGLTLSAGGLVELLYSSDNGSTWKGASDYRGTLWNGSTFATDVLARAAQAFYNSATSAVYFSGRITAAGTAAAPSVCESSAWGMGAETPQRSVTIAATNYAINALKFQTVGGETFTGGAINLWLR